MQQIAQDRPQVRRGPSALHHFAAQGHRQKADPQSKGGVFCLLPQAAGEINHGHPSELSAAAEWGRDIGRRGIPAMLEGRELARPDGTKTNK